MSHLSISRAWEEAKAIWAREQRLIVPVALTMMVLPMAVIGMVSGGQQKVEANDLSPIEALVVTAMAAVTIVGNLGIARLALSRGESVGEALTVAMKRLLPLLGAALLVAIPVIVVAALAGILDASAPDSLAANGVRRMGPGLAVLLVASLVWLAVIGVRLLPLNVVAAAESGGPVQLIRRCWSLTRGHFWRLAGLLALLVIALLVVSAVVGVVAGLVVVLIGGNAPALQPMSLGALAMGFVQGLVNAAAGVLLLLMIVSIYRQLGAGEASVPRVH